jgi:hypothetical protein
VPAAPVTCCRRSNASRTLATGNGRRRHASQRYRRASALTAGLAVAQCRHIHGRPAPESGSVAAVQHTQPSWPHSLPGASRPHSAVALARCWHGNSHAGDRHGAKGMACPRRLCRRIVASAAGTEQLTDHTQHLFFAPGGIAALFANQAPALTNPDDSTTTELRRRSEGQRVRRQRRVPGAQLEGEQVRVLRRRRRRRRRPASACQAPKAAQRHSCAGPGAAMASKVYPPSSRAASGLHCSVRHAGIHAPTPTAVAAKLRHRSSRLQACCSG